ncbi:transposase family protein [Desulfobacter sp. UBA2225]|uniref:transposase family protein n=1 Tax=Desulfobacter sp. UBA2225 TaxID=1961413 RepID=UPI00257A000B|nr:transposase family protein [Desulfobacter sp. UBA2225]
MLKHLKSVKDPRHKSYIEYESDIILFSMLMKNACSIYSMSNMTEQFNKDECIKNIANVLGYETLEELPHHDTINNFLCGLKPEEIEKIRDYMIKQLFKKRSLESYRLLNKYWCIAIDATGLFSFSERHCEHCLKKEYKDKETGEVKKTVYYHNVLEAKLVVGDMVFSVATEFIENEDENVSKQDCEINAFKRLAVKLKSKYPRLPICILGDSLYACEPVFEICSNNKWKYLIRFKEGRIKSIAKDFSVLKEIEGNKNKSCTWINDIVYNQRSVNLIETEIEDEANDKKCYVFITDIRITKRNADEIMCFGRSRWKIENQGFNNQKTKKYNVEHANSLNYNAMKNHYLITQLADILRQLYEKGVDKIRDLKKSIKEISSSLLESFRTRLLTNTEDTLNTEKRIQIRFG